MKLDHSRRELEKAKSSIEGMKISKDIHEFESNWRDFLNHLEKVWIKSERECQVVQNKFQPWQGLFIKKRRIDPLLKYLKNARDADVHSIHEIVDKKLGSTKIDFSNKTKAGYIKNLTIRKGVIENYEGDSIEIEFAPARVEAKVFTNNGHTYAPPQYHQGKTVNIPKDPLSLALLGLNYYENYLNEIEKKF